VILFVVVEAIIDKFEMIDPISVGGYRDNDSDESGTNSTMECAITVLHDINVRTRFEDDSTQDSARTSLGITLSIFPI
jgi:hypothetical protein